MKKWIDKNLGIVIIFGTLLVSIPRYAAAFSQAEPKFLGFTIAPVTGTGFGVLLELGIYYVIDSWFDARRRNLKYSWLLLVGFAIQLAIAPVIIAPSIVGHMTANESELSGVLTWEPVLWGWAIVAAAAPALLLAAATAASFMRQPASKKQDDDQQKAGTSKKRTGKASYTCELCGRGFGSQPALNAHQRAHADGNGNEPQPEPAEAAVEAEVKA